MRRPQIKRISPEPDDWDEFTKGMSLFDAIRKQGKYVRQVHDIFSPIGYKYGYILPYTWQTKPMTQSWEKREVWNGLRKACGELGIIWHGFSELPELPDDDF